MSVLDTALDFTSATHPHPTTEKSPVSVSHYRCALAPEPMDTHQNVSARTQHSRTGDSPFLDGFAHVDHSAANHSSRLFAPGNSQCKSRTIVSTKLDSHRLRRKTSPTHKSLRELCAEQQSKQSHLRTMQSDEQLRMAYESQILFYLEGQFADIDSIVE
ncbi:hypothetical protein M433DRAFT_130905 [Acidomyces richmondensis BFW]|nr:hypothetical protein M433DRAFT_130905 [Acidomyces richmondensis BFW]